MEEKPKKKWKHILNHKESWMIKDAYSIDFKIFKKLEHFKKKKNIWASLVAQTVKNPPA